ncbi:DUF4351 domain-containing protein [Chamaesiphon sp. OTE_75_metabat_556]|uniref:DUF4351 domain-containing protein n=1 Tax=Chamaesiphon sp. OTE_75_metabat_556 TaxID=2964692 RepID=UPI00286CB0F3|nr:DUF4351 domain-containing protein [Chamaesiphon sp. OTE_75_metabat_556]
MRGSANAIFSIAAIIRIIPLTLFRFVAQFWHEAHTDKFNISIVELLSIDRLEALGEALLDFNSLQDLQNWLEMAERC